MPVSSELDVLKKMHDAAIELAQYASYAEIVGGIGHNRKPIREWCDKVFALHHEIEAIEALPPSPHPEGRGE